MNVRLGFAILLPFLALALQWVLWPWLHPLVWFLFFPAVFFSSRFAGLRGGLVSTMLSTLIVWYFFIPPQLSWQLRDTNSLFSIALFMVMGYLFSMAHERLHLAQKAAKSRLDESENRFEATFEQAATGIALVSLEGRWLRVNRKLCEIVGYKQKELIALTFQDITHPDDLNNDLTFMSKMLAGEIHTYSMEKRYIRKDGQIIWINLTASLTRKADDTPNYFIAIVEDINTRKQADTELSKFKAIVDSSDDAIISKTLAGIITSWNLGAENIFGYTAAEAVGLSMQMLIPEDRRDEEVEILKKITRGERIPHFETVRRKKNGELIHIATAISPILDRNGHPVGAGKIARDITQRKQAEEEIRASEATLEAALANMSDAVFISDTEGRFIHFNDAFATFHKFKTKDECAKTLSAYTEFLEVRSTAGGILPLEQWAVPRALRGEAATNVELILRRKDTGDQWVGNYSYAPIRNKEGAVTGAVVSARDITERKRVELELRKLAQAVEQSPESIVITDLNANIEYVNEACLHRSGYTIDEVIGKNARILQHIKTPRKTYAELWEALLQGHTWTGEFVNRHKQGGKFIERAIVSPIRQANGQITHYLAVMEDITEKKHLAEELEQHRHHLQELVDQRTAELTAAQQQADAANIAKSSFLANMSHEIRTPMNAVIGLAYLLERAHLPPDANQMVRKISIAGRSLLAVINDILDFSKIEAGRIEIEQAPFRLVDVLENIATIMHVNAGEKDIELIITPPADGIDHLQGDALRLEQILINLVSNGIKFTHSGHVAVSIDTVTESDQQITLRFVVRDTGIGIEPDKQSTIFDSFSQEDVSTTRRFGGSGLGLSISRRLVELMGGEIGVVSMPGSGSEFWFTAPFGKLSGAKLSVPEMAHLHLLIADDNDIAREALRLVTEALDWKAQMVESGEEAVRYVAQERPVPLDVIVLDWKMPHMDGLAAARAIRDAHINEADAPIVIMVTAYSRDELLAAPDSHLVDAVLNKPVTSSSLYNAVAKAQRARSGSQESVHHTYGRRLNGLRILVADDSDINRDVAMRILVGEGAHVVLVNDGRQAVHWLQAHVGEIDVVLMDIQMPIMDGYEATRQIRAIPELAALPVIPLTAGAFKTQVDAAKAAGMTEFIAKPFDVDTAIALILRVTGWTPLPTAAEKSSFVPATAASDEDLPGLAIGRGLSIWKDPAAYRQYLRKFMRDYGDVVQRMTRLDKTEAEALAHKVKGAAGSLALDELSAQAGEVDQILGACGNSADSLVRMQAALDTALASIARYAPPVIQTESVPPKSFDPREAAVLLQRTLAAFHTDSAGAVRPVLAELDKVLPHEHLTALHHALENFNFRGGEQAVLALAAALNLSLDHTI